MKEEQSNSLVKISKNWNSEETKSTGGNAKDSNINGSWMILILILIIIMEEKLILL